MVVKGILQILILRQRAIENVDHNVCVSHIDQHVVSQNKAGFLSDKDSVPNAKIPHVITLAFEIKLDLEVAAAVLLSGLLVFGGDHEIVDYMFLQLLIALYNCGRLIVNICLVHLYRLFAAEVDSAVSQVDAAKLSALGPKGFVRN
jgi:hypothetical protein